MAVISPYLKQRSCLCQYDQDLGDATWNRLSSELKGDASVLPAKNSEAYFNYQAATQWVHTPAAIQAAEVLDIGGEGSSGINILDLGCGSAVWSCAMAHRDPTSTLTVVDHAGAIESARTVASSIDLLSRFESITGDPLVVGLPDSAFDLAILAQQITALDDHAASKLVKRAVTTVKPGGRLVVIDLFRGPGEPGETTNQSAAEGNYAKPTMAESIEALKLCITTTGGRLRTLQQAKEMLVGGGLQQVQFAYLSASRLNLGIAVGVKPAP